jgi:GntR family transcriptional regulator
MQDIGQAARDSRTIAPMAEPLHIPERPAQSAVAAPVAAPLVLPAGPSFSPLYRQIKGLLLQSLQSGAWAPGQAIPSELELAARFKVSQGTVRKAIDELATDNLLVRRQGKGTFVATHAEARTQYRFLRLTPDPGTPPALQRRLLECRRMRAPAEVARLLQLKPGDACVQVRRLLLAAPTAEPGAAAAPEAAASEPVVLDELWLPGTPFKGLTSERLQAWRGPMYRMFESEFAVTMIRAEEKLRAVAAVAEEAALLEVPVGTPLLQVERLSFTYGDRPVEFRRGLYRTGHHHYRNELA